MELVHDLHTWGLHLTNRLVEPQAVLGGGEVSLSFVFLFWTNVEVVEQFVFSAKASGARRHVASPSRSTPTPTGFLRVTRDAPGTKHFAISFPAKPQLKTS